MRKEVARQHEKSFNFNQLTGIAKALEPIGQDTFFINISPDYNKKLRVVHGCKKATWDWDKKGFNYKNEYENFIIPLGTEITDLAQTLNTTNNTFARKFKLLEIKDKSFETKDIKTLESYLKDHYSLSFQKTKDNKILCSLNSQKGDTYENFEGVGNDLDIAVINLLGNLPSKDNNLIKKAYQGIFLPLTARHCEAAHDLATKTLSILNEHPSLLKLLGKPFRTKEEDRLIVKAGIKFPKGIFGIAAGFDKNATMINTLRDIYGAGHVEVGTIIYDSYKGNPKNPTRLVRYGKDKAAGNNFGLPSLGAEIIVRNYEAGKPKKTGEYGIPVGAAIAVNPGIKDYDQKEQNIQNTIDTVVHHNFSWISYSACPNVLAEGQRDQVMEEYKKMVKYFAKTAKMINPHIPLGLKLSPDLNKKEIREIVELAELSGYEIIIATNSSRTIPGYEGNGYSISGAPIFEKSLDVVTTVREVNSKIVIIASGGIDTPEKWAKMQDRGADILSGYIPYIYNPFLIKELKLRQYTV